MSRLTGTQQAYDTLVRLLDQETRKRSGSTKDLEQVRETLDVAFYLLGWSQFEYLVKKSSKDLIDEKAGAQTVERHAWRYLRENLNSLTVGRHLDLIFHARPAVRASLQRDYVVRNEAAHENKYLPKKANYVSNWLRSLEELVGKF